MVGISNFRLSMT